MKFIVNPAVFAKTTNAALKTFATMSITSGDPELTPIATQWFLEVAITTNGNLASFELAENMLRSFLAGGFCANEKYSLFEQVDGGFVIGFTPPGFQKLGENKRREVESVKVKLDFVHFELSHEELFSDLLTLAEYGMMGAANSLSSIAPLVFNGPLRCRLESMTTLFKPLKLALNLENQSNSVEKLVESGLMKSKNTSRSAGPKKNKIRKQKTATDHSLEPRIFSELASHVCTSQDPCKWDSAVGFFATTKFKHRQFVVLTEYGDDLHEPVFFNSLNTEPRD